MTDHHDTLGDAVSNEYKLIGWNVDTQYGFMEQGRNLYVPGSESIRDNLARVTDTLRSEGYQIIHTGDLHTPSDEEIVLNPDDADFKETFPPHCMADDLDLDYVEDGGADHIPETAPVEDAVTFDWREPATADTQYTTFDAVRDGQEAVIYKNKFDVFAGSPHTADVLNAADPDGVLVYGVTTDVCVNQAVHGLLDEGLDVYVVEDAIHEIDPDNPEPAEEAIKDWADKGAHLVATEDAVDALTGAG